MIIKSMGRKASNKMTGGRLKSPFMNLVRYMTRTGDGEKSQSVLWHGFYGHEGMSAEEVARAFEENAEYLKARKNGNVLYHEILSFSTGYALEGDALVQAVTDIGQEYLRYRAPSQMAFGAIHHDTDHIHLHLMVSANGIGRRDREWLTKEQFAGLQKALETFVLVKYPELAQTRIYDRPRIKERLKTQTHEQAMKSRTGEPSRKERIKAQLHGIFEQASSREDLARRLEALGFTFYSRGKSVGVVERLEDGSERRHRLSTLGLEEHYVATHARIEGAGKVQGDQENDVSEKHPMKQGKDAFGYPRDPGAVEIAATEFVTGELHELWHGKPEAEPPEPQKTYTDPILERIRRNERDQEGQGQGDASTKAKDQDRER